MNCLDFRRHCLAEPASRASEFLEHRLHCRSCARFAERVLAFQRKLAEAMAVEPPADLEERILLRQSLHGRSRRRFLAVAASLVLVAGLGVAVVRQLGHDPLAEEVVGHVVERETEIGVDGPAAMDKVPGLLAHFGVRADGPLGEVVLARPCPVGKHMTAHLVVEEGGSEVDVFLIPDAPVKGRRRVEVRGHTGIIVPCPKGSMAIVSRDAEAPLEAIEQRMMERLSWI
ncbi:MAG: DUF3379 family protein [Gammaproteobacteria bacterium]|nr:MAG: DUF3379 family protein [Gammaproteobacteria bacterium]